MLGMKLTESALELSFDGRKSIPKKGITIKPKLL